MKFFATFGQGHYGGLLKDYFIEIEAPDLGKAREFMHEEFGERWSGVYSADDWNPGYFSKGRLGHVARIT
jgi:hypothetical protein